ncbi:helix-turn-helix domain-containing protein [Providencia rettgeri]|uniref:helix-turn-helix domain-containing protein n=1 Tax=Providencia rettgeri TaxID=587 RepID=UPI001CFEF39B|nr:helix-turn-helix domain-containing protein [Providencia rettgeri]EIU7558162.1 helix-turn-helix domain-containing protein [Providencia rettgeri]MCB4842088.1 helix-turn-helix domain-containing protein [Providencia rettgeri]
MNKEYDFLMRNASCALVLAEQAQCIGLLILSGKLSETESEIIEVILQEKFRALIDTSSSIKSSIAFDFPLKNEIKVEQQTTGIKNSFAARLRLAIAHSGMKQSDLAEWVGVSQGAISSYVTGKVKEAGIARARLMAQALRVSALWLIYGEGEIQPAKFLTHNDEV